MAILVEKSRLEAITVELRSMLADLNAFGDGSLAEVPLNLKVEESLWHEGS